MNDCTFRLFYINIILIYYIQYKPYNQNNIPVNNYNNDHKKL